jgi:hypothetical protein
MKKAAMKIHKVISTVTSTLLIMGAIASIGSAPAHAASAPKTFTITPSSGSAPYGSAISVTVFASGSGGDVTGTVQILDSANPIGTPCTLIASSCVLALPLLAVGTHSLTAAYTGGSHKSGTYGSALVLISQGTVNISVTTDVNPLRLGTGGTSIRATIVGASGALLPTGTIQFKDGGNNLGSPSTLSAGVTAISSDFTLGTHVITAVYSGDANYASGGTSNSVNQNVIRGIPVVTLVSDNPHAIIGEAINFTATVTGSLGDSTGGTVTMYAYLENKSVGTCSITAGNSCVIALGASTVGDHRIWASYSGNSVYDLANSAYSIQSNRSPTQPSVVITFANNTIDFGQTATAIATVSSPEGLPTGFIQWEVDDVAAGVECPLVNGTCSTPIPGLSAGEHTIVGEYGGDGRAFTASEGSNAITVRKVALATTVELFASQAPSITGRSVTFTATVKATDQTPTGTLVFAEGATDLATCTLSAGRCTFSTSLLTTGTHSITARYAGVVDEYLASTVTISHQVNAPSEKTTSTALALSPLPVIVDGTTTLTATVTNNAEVSGTVIFKKTGTEIGRCTLVGGSCAVTYAFTAIGSFDLSAEFQANTNFDASFGLATVNVVKHPTTLVVTSSANPSSWLQVVTFTITMPSTVTGDVIIEDGENPSTSCRVVSGTCSLTRTFGVSGLHDMTFEYNGDDKNAPIYVHFNQTVGLEAPSVTLTTSPETAEFGTPVTLTAQLSKTTARGLVIFREGSTPLASCTISTNGTCSVEYSHLSVGVHSIIADYAGEAGVWAGAKSAEVNQVINRGSVSVTLTSSSASSPYGTVLTLTARAVGLGDGPRGAIHFEDYTSLPEVVLGECQIIGDSCSFAVIAPLSLGAHTLKAEYKGDSNYLGGYSLAYSQTITPLSSGLSIVSSNSVAVLGNPVTFNIFVNVSPGPATGTVQLKDGENLLGSALILVEGRASLTTSTLAIGTHVISGTYGGDSTYEGLTSISFNQVVGAPPTVTLVPATSTITIGTVATFTVTVSGASGTPTGKVTLEEVVGAGSDRGITSCTLASGTCVISVPLMEVGTHKLYAEYEGDGTFIFANSSQSTLIVNALPATPVPTPKPPKETAPVVIVPPAPVLQSSRTAKILISPTTVTDVQFNVPNPSGERRDIKLSVPAGAATGISYAVVAVSQNPVEIDPILNAIKIEIFDINDRLITTLAKPISILIGRFGTVAKPATSSDGVVWSPMQKLASSTLPTGVTQGWYKDKNGALIIVTAKTSYFDIKKPQGSIFVHAPDRHIKVGAYQLLAITGGMGSGVVTYATSTPTVCSVSKSGLLTGLQVGSCYVTVSKAGDGSTLAAVSKPLLVAIRR